MNNSSSSASKKRLLKISIFNLILFSFFAFSKSEDLFQLSKNLDIFASVYRQVSLNYVDEPNPSKMIKTGIDSMLDELDPYTQFVPESEVEDYKLKYVSNQYGGIGASVSIRSGKIIISETFDGFPAQKGGLRAGDELLEIYGKSVIGKNNQEVGSLLKGTKNTTVELLIKRINEPKPVKITLIREEIKQGNVSYFGMLENQVGYVKLDRFLENSAQEVKDAIINLQKNKLSGLILDLRGNGGGILQESVKIVNLFVDKGLTVVEQKGRNNQQIITYKTTFPAFEPNLPLVVLVDNQSASASEIVAGSLQDLDRAVIIGQRSFGKGLVQQTFNLPYNSLVKVTMAKYYTPSGRCIQALNYKNRDSDGKITKLPDSLINEFKTKNGRTVYDGSGIFPDLFVSPLKNSFLTNSLISGFHIFDYATQYHSLKPKMLDPKSFKLSDADYEDFVKFLSARNFSYKSTTEKLFEDLGAEIKKDKNAEQYKIELDALKAKISASKKNELYIYKDEIKRHLESEIVSRYFYQKGRIEYYLQHDKELNEAQKMLSNNIMLSAILKGEGKYKSIGKPVE